MFTVIKGIIKENFSNHERIWFLGKASFSKQVKATTLGIGWIVIQDLIYILTFAMVRSFFAGGNTINGMGHAPWLLAGLLPWFYVNDILNSSTRCFKTHKNIYGNMNFPMTIIPTFEMLGVFMKRSISFVLIFVAMVIMGFLPTTNFLLLLYYLFSMIVLCMVLNLLISPLIAISKDFEQLYRAGLKILFFMVPILWQFDQVMEISPVIASILKINPIPYLMIGFRDAFYYGNLPALNYTIYFWVFNIVFFIVGCTIIEKLKKYFDDWV